MRNKIHYSLLSFMTMTTYGDAAIYYQVAIRSIVYVSSLYTSLFFCHRLSCESFRMEKSFKTAFKEIKALMVVIFKSTVNIVTKRGEDVT